MVVVRACRDLEVVRRTRRDGDLVAGVLEDGARGVASVGAFVYDLESEVEEVLLESDNMVVVGSARDFRSIVARFHEEMGDFDDGIHGGDAAVSGERAWWLLGIASVVARVGLLVGASVGWSLSREWRQDVVRAIGQSQSESIGRIQSGSIGWGLGQR